MLRQKLVYLKKKPPQYVCNSFIRANVADTKKNIVHNMPLIKSIKSGEISKRNMAFHYFHFFCKNKDF